MNAEKTSEILQIPIEIIESFREINNIISNPKDLDPDLDNFQEIANFLLYMLTQIEPFNITPLFPTVHRALLHGQHYIRHFQNIWPIAHGALSESALESRNKYNHRFREHFAFKGSLKKNLRDLGVRHLLSSDPYISLKLRKKANKFA
jgi:hypothetical protein